MTLNVNAIYMKPRFFNDEPWKIVYQHFENRISTVGQVKVSVHQNRKKSLESAPTFAMNLNTKSSCKKSSYY